MGMVTLLLVLVTTAHHGSYSTAGVVTACFGVGSAASAPFRGSGDRPAGHAAGAGGQLVRRDRGHRRVPRGLDVAVANAGCVLALAMGLLVPPVEAMMRSLWRVLLELRDTAFALESVVTELVYVAGPLLVTITLIVGSPDDRFVAAVGARIALSRYRCVHSPCPTGRSWQASGLDGRSSSPRPATAPGSSVSVVRCVGCGGLRRDLGGQRARRHLDRRCIRCRAVDWQYRRRPVLRVPSPAGLAASTVWFVGLSVIPGLVGVGLVLAASGIAVAPMITVQYAWVERVAPDRYMTEAFTWMNAASSAGGAASTAIAGTLAGAFDAGGAFLLAGAMTLLGTVLTATMVTGEAPASLTGR